MSRWSDVMKLTVITSFAYYLKGNPGVYQLGYMRGGFFLPRYIGRARTEKTCLYTRLTSYYSARCHNNTLKTKLGGGTHHVWFRVCRVSDPAFTEAHQLYTHEIGLKGRYDWNERYEYSALRHGGWEFEGD